MKLGGDRVNLAEVRLKGVRIRVAVRKAKASSRAADLASIIAEVRGAGARSLREIAAGLNAHQVLTARGGEWALSKSSAC